MSDEKPGAPEMIDVVVRAICPLIKPWLDAPDQPRHECLGCPAEIVDPNYGPMTQGCRHAAEEIARAAILALREPTIAVGAAFYDTWDSFGEDAIMGPEEAIAIWRAAIDAILKEQP